jgi:hypothetical protein
LLLSETARVEVFIPDLPDPSYSSLLTQLETELSYAFGGCTLLSASGTFRSTAGRILLDKITILFTDIPLELERDRLRLGDYMNSVREAIQEVLALEESILVAVHPVHHIV